MDLMALFHDGFYVCAAVISRMRHSELLLLGDVSFRLPVGSSDLAYYVVSWIVSCFS